MYTFKAKCIADAQSPEGSHVATFEGVDGKLASVPSGDISFVVGEQYTISIEKPRVSEVVQANG